MNQYNNPIPVAVLLVPFIDTDGIKLLLVKRNIEPKKGLFALPGGFVDEGERIETAALRELYEETGLELAGEYAIQMFRSRITPNNQVLIFCTTDDHDMGDIDRLSTNSEVSGFALSSLTGERDTFAFPLHAEVAKIYLKIRNNPVEGYVYD